jgi:hypothetical protein
MADQTGDKAKIEAEAKAKADAEAAAAEERRLEAHAKIDAKAGLVEMRKKGEKSLKVHPTCVRSHESAGWEVAQ